MEQNTLELTFESNSVKGEALPKSTENVKVKLLRNPPGGGGHVPLFLVFPKSISSILVFPVPSFNFLLFPCSLKVNGHVALFRKTPGRPSTL